MSGYPLQLSIIQTTSTARILVGQQSRANDAFQARQLSHSNLRRSLPPMGDRKTRRSAQKTTALIWHKRLGHPGPAAIENLVHHSEGVQIKGVTTVECDACGKSKSISQIRRTPRISEEGSGERIALDFHSFRLP